MMKEMEEKAGKRHEYSRILSKYIACRYKMS